MGVPPSLTAGLECVLGNIDIRVASYPGVEKPKWQVASTHQVEQARWEVTRRHWVHKVGAYNAAPGRCEGRHGCERGERDQRGSDEQRQGSYFKLSQWIHSFFFPFFLVLRVCFPLAIERKRATKVLI
jgi:hypothetical protein